MVHGSQALGWFNPMFFEPVGTSPHPAIWLRKVGLLSSQSEPWVDATCSFKIEHPRCAENQALANHWCSVEHVLLHALVKYTIQLALQSTFSYTWYNGVVWALEARWPLCSWCHGVWRVWPPAPGKGLMTSCQPVGPRGRHVTAGNSLADRNPLPAALFSVGSHPQTYTHSLIADLEYSQIFNYLCMLFLLFLRQKCYYIQCLLETFSFATCLPLDVGKV